MVMVTKLMVNSSITLESRRHQKTRPSDRLYHTQTSPAKEWVGDRGYIDSSLMAPRRLIFFPHLFGTSH